MHFHILSDTLHPASKVECPFIIFHFCAKNAPQLAASPANPCCNLVFFTQLTISAGKVNCRRHLAGSFGALMPGDASLPKTPPHPPYGPGHRQQREERAEDPGRNARISPSQQHGENTLSVRSNLANGFEIPHSSCFLLYLMEAGMQTKKYLDLHGLAKLVGSCRKRMHLIDSLTSLSFHPVAPTASLSVHHPSPKDLEN